MQEFPDIINWRRIDVDTTTSGQPTEAQLAQLRDAGIRHIVNLGPHTNKGALEDEPGTVEALGMTYTYIPVEFSAPTDADFAAFCDALTACKGAPTHVHCIYNARVSAFFYRYAASGLGGSPDTAFARMDGIWRPGDDWAAFTGLPQAKGTPNEYAGDEYDLPKA